MLQSKNPMKATSNDKDDAPPTASSDEEHCYSDLMENRPLVMMNGWSVVDDVVMAGFIFVMHRALSTIKEEEACHSLKLPGGVCHMLSLDEGQCCP
jgi:hypothetical protein